jgi:uncharacterized membrane protein
MFYVRIVYAVVLLFAIYTIYSLHPVSSRDPTSVFFNPQVGYVPSYSSIRTQQAESFIAAVVANRTVHAPPDNAQSNYA